MGNWSSKGYTEALQLVKGQARNSEAFSDEFAKVTENLYRGENYFHVHYGKELTVNKRRQARRSSSTRIRPEAIGIAIDGRGYIFSRKEEEPGDDRDLDHFGFLGLKGRELGGTTTIDWTAYAQDLKYPSDDMPDPISSSGERLDLYYKLLRDVSNTPWKDIRALKPDYTPPVKNRRVIDEIGKEEPDISEEEYEFYKKLLDERDRELPDEWSFIKDQVEEYSELQDD